MLSAYTTEVDEIDDAFNEITAQIDLNSLDANSVGILYCHPEFAETGVATAICERLPFDVIGMTVAAVAGGGSYGTYGLSLCVLTGNDVSFTTTYTDPFTAEDFEGKIDAAYKQARASVSEDPAFILSCFPMMNELMATVCWARWTSLATACPFTAACATASTSATRRAAQCLTDNPAPTPSA